MAIRHLLCGDCAGRIVATEDPGVHLSLVWGKLKLDRPIGDIIMRRPDGSVIERITLEQCSCDGCGASIPRGADACARTFWHDPQGKPEWELEYLECIARQERHDW